MVKGDVALACAVNSWEVYLHVVSFIYVGCISDSEDGDCVIKSK